MTDLDFANVCQTKIIFFVWRKSSIDGPLSFKKQQPNTKYIIIMNVE